MTEIRILVSEPSADADPHQYQVLELTLPRCRLPRCQKILRPGLEFCDDAPHRQEFHNKFNITKN